MVSLHHAVGAGCADLSSGCEALLAEKAALQELADALRARLAFFDGYEKAAAEFAAAAAAGDGSGSGGAATVAALPPLLPLLARIDDAIAYVAANPQYADSIAYAARFRQLQARALGLVRSRAQAALRAAAAAAQQAAAEAAAGAAAGGGAGAAPLSPRAAAAAGGGGGLLRQGSSRQAPAPLPEGLEVATLYVRFRAAAEPALKAALAGVEARAARPEYARLLDEVRGLHCAARQQLVAPHFAARLGARAGAELPALLRGGVGQLLRTAQLEAQLYEQLFCTTGGGGGSGGGGGGSGGDGGSNSEQQQQQQQQLQTAAAQLPPPPPPPPPADALRPLLEPLASLLYDALRPRFVQLADVDAIAALVDILRSEAPDARAASDARAAAVLPALKPVLDAALSDLQQRLIYRAQALVRQEVAVANPSPADVDYPARLERLAREEEAAAAAAAAAAASGGGDCGAAQEGEIAPAEGAAAAAEAAEGGGGAVVTAAEAAAAAAAGPDPLARWYGPVRAALLLLSKLYRCLPPATFAGLATEAVAACTASVEAGARVVAANASPLDGQLFAIMHLLLLREQVAQFDVDLVATDTGLDFSHMRSHVRRIVAGEASLFALSASNAVVQMLVGRGGPRAVAAQSDAKRELEARLRAACEEFILAVTRLAIEPMLAFITKVTAVRATAAGAGAGAGGAAGGAAGAAAAAPPPQKALKEHAFAAPDKLAAAVARVNDAMAGPVRDAAAKARLYLTNPATRAILFRPIKSNIAEAHGQIAQLLEAEYTPEEAALVPLMGPDALGAALDF